MTVQAAVGIRLASALDLEAISEVEHSAAEAFLATEHADAPDPPPMARDVYLRFISTNAVG